MKKYISDEITNKEIDSWKPENIVIINSDTGTGKSSFVLNDLSDMAKKNGHKILYLVPRLPSKKQFRKKVKKKGKDSTIDVHTYQTIEKSDKFKKTVKEYKYIICDECDYFLQDSDINNYTEVSWNEIIHNTNNSIKIFLSATMDFLAEYMRKYENISTIKYSVKNNDNRIEKLTYFSSMDDLYNLIEDFKNRNEKTVFFMNKKEIAQLYKKHKDYSLFYCSENHKYASLMNSYKINNMLENEYFDELFLFTTSVADSAINFNWYDIDNIVVLMTDIRTIRQCIGRRRFNWKNPNDKINVYIQEPSGQQLGGYYTKNKRSIEKAEYYLENGKNRYLMKYPRENDKDDIVTVDKDADGQTIIHLNNWKLFKRKKSIEELKDMKDWGFPEWVTPDLKCDSWERMQEISLMDKLNNFVGKVLLTKEEKNQFAEIINVRRNSKLKKSKNAINAILEEDDIPFRIVQLPPTTKRINGEKKNYNTPWKIERFSS